MHLPPRVVVGTEGEVVDTVEVVVVVVTPGEVAVEICQ